jgi:hypothetical protein
MIEGSLSLAVEDVRVHDLRWRLNPPVEAPEYEPNKAQEIFNWAASVQGSPRLPAAPVDVRATQPLTETTLHRPVDADLEAARLVHHLQELQQWHGMPWLSTVDEGKLLSEVKALLGLTHFTPDMLESAFAYQPELKPVEAINVSIAKALIEFSLEAGRIQAQPVQPAPEPIPFSQDARQESFGTTFSAQPTLLETKSASTSVAPTVVGAPVVPQPAKSKQPDLPKIPTQAPMMKPVTLKAPRAGDPKARRSVFREEGI